MASEHRTNFQASINFRNDEYVEILMAKCHRFRVIRSLTITSSVINQASTAKNLYTREVITLPAIDAEDFNSYVNWVYRKCISSIDVPPSSDAASDEEAEYMLLVRLYEFGEVLQDRKFQAAIPEAITKKHNKHMLGHVASEFILPRPFAVQLVHEHRGTSQLLWNLLRNTYARTRALQEIAALSNEFPDAFRLEVILAKQAMKVNQAARYHHKEISKYGDVCQKLPTRKRKRVDEDIEEELAGAGGERPIMAGREASEILEQAVIERYNFRAHKFRCSIDVSERSEVSENSTT